MNEQIFVSYRRTGGDVSAKLICETLKNHGFTVFYDYDSIHGELFDTRITTAIEECDDFILVLPVNALDRCVNENDWVRQEISCALKHQKNIIPVILPGFSFPAALPQDISIISRINYVDFSMPFFDAMIQKIIERLKSTPSLFDPSYYAGQSDKIEFDKFKFVLNEEGAYTAFCLSNNDKTLIVPHEYEGKPITEIGEKVFTGSNLLEEVKLPRTVKRIGSNAFEGCSALKRILLPRELESIGSSAFSGCTSLESLSIPNGTSSIGECAFKGCQALVAVKLPASLTLISKETFSGCHNLCEIVVPPSVTCIGDRAFFECRLLSRAILPNSINEIGSHAFSWCMSLSEIVLPRDLTEIKCGLFSSCNSLKNISIPEGVTTIEGSAFWFCHALKDITLPKGITYIGPSAFSHCTHLLRITLPEQTKISGWAFSDCQNLTSVDAREVLSIGTGAFFNCSSLERVYLSYSLREIGSEAFHKCKPNIEIIFYGRKDDWKKIKKESKCFPVFARLPKFR